jgi:hypothetical protein
MGDIADYYSDLAAAKQAEYEHNLLRYNKLSDKKLVKEASSITDSQFILNLVSYYNDHKKLSEKQRKVLVEHLSLNFI